METLTRKDIGVVLVLYCLLGTDFKHNSGASIVNFQQVNVNWITKLKTESKNFKQSIYNISIIDVTYVSL